MSYCNPANGHQLDAGLAPIARTRMSRDSKKNNNALSKASQSPEDYFSALSLKKQAQAAERATSPLLSGCVIHTTGFLSSLSPRNHSDRSFRHLVESHSAIFKWHMSSEVTHVVCDSLASSKREQLLKSIGNVKRRKLEIVTADWIFACIDANKRVSEEGYRVLAADGERENGAGILSYFGKSKNKMGRPTRPGNGKGKGKKLASPARSASKAQPSTTAENSFVEVNGVVILDD